MRMEFRLRGPVDLCIIIEISRFYVFEPGKICLDKSLESHTTRLWSRDRDKTWLLLINDTLLCLLSVFIVSRLLDHTRL